MYFKIISAILLLGTVVLGGFCYDSYSKTSTLRTTISTVSVSSQYYNELDDYLNKMVEEDRIHIAHKGWIKDFIIKELPKNDNENSFNNLLKKLNDKNIKLNTTEKNRVKMQLLNIKEASLKRDSLINENLKAYSAMRNNKFDALVEELFIGEKLKYEDIKRY